jgi:hypothetical protein
MAEPGRPDEETVMRFGNVEIRPLGGGIGCLAMIVGSILLSILLTVVVNVLAR